jgi:hypothetical protein
MGKRTKVKVDPLDPQRHLVYAWEDEWRCFGERSLTREQAERCVRRLARKWSVPVPTLVFLPRGNREWSYVQGERLALNFDQCCEAIVAHEMAHWVVGHEYPDGTYQIHGPEFVAIYIEMLVYLKEAPRTAICASLLERGIEWTTEVD